MKKHLQYLWYVLKHKWFVFVECCKWLDPVLVWRGIIHDWQKFTPAEWSPYVLSFWGPWEYKDRPPWLVEAFDRAWLHHQHLGPHHWQYWVLREDSGNIKCLEMPQRYWMEMLADWHGAGRAIKGKDADTRAWYIENHEKIKLHPVTRKWVEIHLGIITLEEVNARQYDLCKDELYQDRP